MFSLQNRMPDAVYVKAENCWEVAQPATGRLYAWRDVSVSLDEKGGIDIRANDTKPQMIRMSWKTDIPADTLVYGDAWERAYGDLEWRSVDMDRMLPWYMLLYHNGVTTGIGVKVQPNAFCYWRCSCAEIVLTIDVKSGTNGIDLSKRTLHAADLVEGEFTENVHAAAKAFCGLMCTTRRLPKHPIFGGNDWYCNYGHNSWDKIVEHTQRICECSAGLPTAPYMVIDDGWQICHCEAAAGVYSFNGGPWNCANSNFGDMQKMADKISSIGATPGIWFRPLLTAEKIPSSAVLRYYPDRGGAVLDPSNPDNLERVKADVRRIRDWGYKLIKHDFTTYELILRWIINSDNDIETVPTNFMAKDKTTAEIVKGLYTAIREAAGDSVLIIGCNTFSHLSAGLFEIQRTGDDTSGVDWERTKTMGINTLAFRMMQNNIFYAADADCVGLTNQVDYSKNKQWLDVLARSGTPLFVSIAEDAYSAQAQKDLTRAFYQAAHAKGEGIALDWFETKTPRKWRFADGSEETYTW